MFAPFGKLDEGEEIIPIPPHHLLPNRHCRRPLFFPLVMEGELPCSIPCRFLIGTPDKGVEEPYSLVGTFPGQKQPRRGKAVTGMIPCILPVGIEQLCQVCGQGRQGKDVEAVVFEDVGHETPVAATKPVKIPLRNLAPRDVPLPLEAEESRLQGTQTAVCQAMAQKPPGRME